MSDRLPGIDWDDPGMKGSITPHDPANEGRLPGVDWGATRRQSAPSAALTTSRQMAPHAGEQLKMFMTPREIHAGWQPLDADRQGNETYREYSGSGTFQMGRHTTTGGGSAYGTNYGYDASGNYYQRTEGGSKYMERPETDEELWSRKADEAYGYEDYGGEHMVGTPSRWTVPEHRHSGGTPTADLSTTAQRERLWAPTTSGGGRGSYYTQGTEEYVPGNQMTLGESIEAEGVKSPIRLGQTIGSQGKPEIVGGHHRLAVATSVNPDQFVPVLHHQDIYEAKQNKSYKYT